MLNVPNLTLNLIKIVLRNGYNKIMRFQDIYPRYNALISACIFQYRNLETFDDMKQEILIKIYLKCETIEDPTAVKSWLSRLINNYAIDLFRKKKIEMIPLEYSEFIDLKPTADELLEIKEKRRTIEAIFNEMEEHPAAILRDREINHLSYPEIARKHQIPLGTVKSQIFRAKIRFRNCIEVINL